MPESRGQSQETADVAVKRWWPSSRRQFFFFLLLLAAFLLLYNTDIKALTPDFVGFARGAANAMSNANGNANAMSNASGNANGSANCNANGNAASSGSNATSNSNGTASNGANAATNANTARNANTATNTSNGASNANTANGANAVTNATTGANAITPRPQPHLNATSSTLTDAAVSKVHPPNAVPYKSPGPYLVEYPYSYRYVINEPRKCEDQKPFVVLVVPVAPQNREHRDVVRETWGGEGVVLGKPVTLVFLLGLHSGPDQDRVHQDLQTESRQHRDLVQSDFVDCYKNLTIKTMVMLEWLEAHCRGAAYAMKIDSDMFLNVPNLVNMLLNAPKTGYLSGLVATGAGVVRDRRSKWFLPLEVYPAPQFPRYALGLGYVFSLDLPKKLVEASRNVKAVYIEDVYLGLCMQHLHLNPTDPPNWGFFQVFPVTYSRCAFSKLVATTTHEHADRRAFWKDFKRPGPYCVQESPKNT